MNVGTRIRQQLVEQRRARILRLVEAGSHNLEVIYTLLLPHSLGTLDDIRADVVWLAGEGLLVVEFLADMQLAHLTKRGHEVAIGQNTHAGVGRVFGG